MRKLSLILLISWVYVACGPMREPGRPVPEPTPADPVGELRVVLPEGVSVGTAAGYRFLEEIFLATACSEGLVRENADGMLEPALATSWERRRLEDGTCLWRFEIRPDDSIAPQEILDHWRQRLIAGDALLSFLLRPVAGETGEIAGIRVEDGALELDTGCESFGMDRRLAQFGASVSTQGAFDLDPESQSAVASPDYPGPRRLARFRWIDAGAADPGWLLVAGEADVAVVHGRSLSVVESAEPGALEMKRIPVWDRTYALWLNREARWVSDPAFRRWLAETVDRKGILDYLFAGHGSPADRLLPDAKSSVPSPAEYRPFSEGAKPRLILAYDEADRYASIVASRIRADLEPAGVRVDLMAGAGESADFETAEDAPSMVLIAHQPPTVDPVLALWYTVAGLGTQAGDALEALEAASAASDGQARRSMAELAELALTDDHRLIPLVRLDAWLVHRSGLEGIEAGPAGIVRLEGARWR